MILQSKVWLLPRLAQHILRGDISYHHTVLSEANISLSHQQAPARLWI